MHHEHRTSSYIALIKQVSNRCRWIRLINICLFVYWQLELNSWKMNNRHLQYNYYEQVIYRLLSCNYFIVFTIILFLVYIVNFVLTSRLCSWYLVSLLVEYLFFWLTFVWPTGHQNLVGKWHYCCWRWWWWCWCDELVDLGRNSSRSTKSYCCCCEDP